MTFSKFFSTHAARGRLAGDGEDVLESQGVDFELDAPEEEIGAAPEIEDAVFRVFQEAASNVVRHADAKNVSALLLDISMPNLGGLEVLAELQKVNPELKVIIVSQHTDRA